MENTDVDVRPTRTQVERGLSWQPPHLHTALTTMRGHVLALQSVSFLWSMDDTVTVEVREFTYRSSVRARVTSYTEPAWADNQDGANVRMALLGRE